MLAAVGSFLQVRSAGGRWLLRIDDVDSTRSRSAAAAQILRTLEAFGFEWDGPLWRQSEHRDAYDAALQLLRESDELFLCQCSRRKRIVANADGESRCTGGCAARQQGLQEHDCSLRWHAPARGNVAFDDLWQGRQQTLCAALGDVVLRRRDGLHAYQLAVVIDDAAQGVTQVIRGADLLASSFWQILLQRRLRLPQPQYGHLPLLVEPDGRKLSKSRQSVALESRSAAAQLLTALWQLRQPAPSELAHGGVSQVWQWALRHWQPDRLRNHSRVLLAGDALASRV